MSIKSFFEIKIFVLLKNKSYNSLGIFVIINSSKLIFNLSSKNLIYLRLILLDSKFITITLFKYLFIKLEFLL